VLQKPAPEFSGAGFFRAMRKRAATSLNFSMIAFIASPA
jgi:hypothetical protein